MHSHVSLSRIPDQTQHLAITCEMCDSLRNNNFLKLNDHPLENLTPGRTNFVSHRLVGRVDANSACKGGTYLDYDDVIVTLSLEVYYTTNEATLKRATNKLILSTGTNCNYDDGTCHDSNENTVFWTTTEKSKCDLDTYSILYEGHGIKTRDDKPDAPTIYFSNATDDKKFAFSDHGDKNICGINLKQTEQKNIFIYETTPRNPFPTRSYKVGAKDVLLTTYFNTKIMYVANHFKKEINSLYRDIITHRCLLEQ